MIRLKDVAARAGVSLMTVSNVLRDAPDVSQATKSRVRRLAEEMGYVPDALARGLRTRRTRLFGLVVPTLSHWPLSQVATTIENRARDLGYDVLIGQSHDDPQREEACIRRLLSRRIDGLFLYPVYRLAPTAPIYDELRESRTPTVLLGHTAPFCNGFISVEPDEVAASLLLTQHLLRLGHKRIAFLAGPPAAPWAQERFDGYRRALREAQVPWDDRLVFTAGTTIEDGQKAAHQFLGEATGATAIQAVTDLVALGAATVLWERGLRIPEDLSLTGFGNHPLSEFLRIPLTTVQQPKSGIGNAAVECMARLLRGEAQETKRLQTEVLVRASTSTAHRAGTSALQNPIPTELSRPRPVV